MTLDVSDLGRHIQSQSCTEIKCMQLSSDGNWESDRRQSVEAIPFLVISTSGLVNAPPWLASWCSK